MDNLSSTFLVAPYEFEDSKRNRMELSAHVCSKFFIRELHHVFQSTNLENLIAIPTMQRARMDLVNFGSEVDEEKDRLLETFMEFAKNVCLELQSHGCWADYIDPCSGLPMLTQDCNKVYSEVAGAEILLKYRVQNANCCKILFHPTYGSSVYPASIFTTSPPEILLLVLKKLIGYEWNAEIQPEI